MKEPQGSLTEQTLMAGGPLHTWGLRAVPPSKDRGLIRLCALCLARCLVLAGASQTPAEQGKKGEKKADSHRGPSLNRVHHICTLEAPASCQVSRWLLLKRNGLPSPLPRRSFLRQEQPVQFIFYMPSARAMKLQQSPGAALFRQPCRKAQPRSFQDD